MFGFNHRVSIPNDSHDGSDPAQYLVQQMALVPLFPITSFSQLDFSRCGGGFKLWKSFGCLAGHRWWRVSSTAALRDLAKHLDSKCSTVGVFRMVKGW